MRSFFKIVLATFLSLVFFSFLVFFLLFAWIGSLASKQVPDIRTRSVLVLDLGQHFQEQAQDISFGNLTGSVEGDVPGLYDVVRLIKKARNDDNIRGIYLLANFSPNGFAANDEIRQALVEFRQANKFIIAYGDILTQRAYHVATAADKIYLNPAGQIEWAGYSVDLAFVKGTLDKLEIEPQIFYAGKFKSATEPFRTDKMTEENRLQTNQWLGDLYAHFLVTVAAARKTDTATLHRIANEGLIQRPEDAVTHKLVDSLKYDDQVKDEIKSRLELDKYDKINFVSINTYAETGVPKGSGQDRIALIYAEGDIVDGRGSDRQIGSETFRRLVRNARLDKNVKAIVFRINSGGGSALASENIWRELELAKKDKPVVVSFGDVAASGGYYIGCMADSIFAAPTTITGSIGVFGLIPNMEDFFRNKLGITFDGVKTGPFANTGTPYRPLNETEKKMIQAEIDRIYVQFKQRVADGRKMDTVIVDSIGQGRVWSGSRAKDIGLVDRFGGLHDAVESAARLAKLENYRVREYPEPETLLQKIFGSKTPLNKERIIEKEIGASNYKIYKELQRVHELTNSAQARLPFDFFIH